MCMCMSVLGVADFRSGLSKSSGHPAFPVTERGGASGSEEAEAASQPRLASMQSPAGAVQVTRPSRAPSVRSDGIVRTGKKAATCASAGLAAQGRQATNILPAKRRAAALDDLPTSIAVRFRARQPKAPTIVGGATAVAGPAAQRLGLGM